MKKKVLVNFENILKNYYLFLVFLSLSFKSNATTYYMATTGSDINNGSITAPWKTLKSSSGKLVAGDILLIRAGTYPDKGVTWTATIGTAIKPIIIKNYPGETPVFDGANTTSGCIMAVASKYTIWDGLTFQNYQAVSGGVIWIGYSGSGTNFSVGNVIRNCVFKKIGSGAHTDHAIYVSYGNTDITINNNKFYNISGGAVHAYHGPGVQRAEIFNNLVFHALWAVIIADGAKDVHIYNNLIVDCGKALNGGVELNYSGQGETSAHGNVNTVVRNNIFYSNYLALNTGAQTVNATISNNLFFSNTNIGNQGIAAVLTNPLLVNFKIDGSGDYHLTSASPAKDAGISSGAPLTDFDGIARPQGLGLDIGPYEYSLSTGIENSFINEARITVYPNPFTTAFNVKISPEIIISDAVMEIYDMCGKEVKVISINNSETIIDRDDLSNGLYFYKVISDKKNIAKGKLLIQN